MCVSLFLIEDEALLADLVKVVAEDLGFRVTIADNLETISNILSAQTPDVVILDLNIPGVEIDSVLRLLATRAVTAKVVVTSGAGQAKIEEVFEQGQRIGIRMHAAVSKPFDIQELESVLSDLRGDLANTTKITN